MKDTEMNGDDAQEPAVGVAVDAVVAAVAEEAANEGEGGLAEEERELIRDLVMADPELVLGDDRVMRALIGATHPGTAFPGAAPVPPSRKVVDLRDKLVERLEARLSRLVHTNRSVIAAAYENVASTGALHAAVTDLMAADDLPAFAAALSEALPARVSIEAARLCIEGDVTAVTPATGLGPAGATLLFLPRGTVEHYLGIEGRPAEGGIVLREAPAEAEALFPREHIASEALLPLTLGAETGLLALGSSDPERFSPDQGTELLRFLAAIVSRLATEHLAAYDAIGA
ncbi:MAG: DUF484 family protein [Pseudomonadota bacterium]